MKRILTFAAYAAGMLLGGQALGFILLFLTSMVLAFWPSRAQNNEP